MIGRARTTEFGRPHRMSIAKLKELSESLPAIEAGNGVSMTRSGSRFVVSSENTEVQPMRQYWGVIYDWYSRGESRFPNQWVYQISEIIRIPDADPEEAPTKFEDRVDGRVLLAYNTIEFGNTGEGIEGNGVNVDTLPEGFKIMPIGIGAVVLVHFVRNSDGSDYTSWFSAVNVVDGECQQQE